MTRYRMMVVILASVWAAPTCLLHGQTTQGQIISPRAVAKVSSGVHDAPSHPPAFPQLANPKTAHADGSVAEVESETKTASGKLTTPVVTVASSLITVLALFGVLVWATRKFGARSLGGGSLPKDLIQTLGTTAIDARTRMTLVRCGTRVLILAQSPTGIQTLGEISDTDEVRSIVAACVGDSQNAFDQTLRAIERERVSPGYVGQTPETSKSVSQPPRRGLFATA